MMNSGVEYITSKHVVIFIDNHPLPTPSTCTADPDKTRNKTVSMIKPVIVELLLSMLGASKHTITSDDVYNNPHTPLWLIYKRILREWYVILEADIKRNTPIILFTQCHENALSEVKYPVNFSFAAQNFHG